jgi:flagellar biosynthesis protein FlhF
MERIRRALEFHGVPKLLAADLLKSAKQMESEDALSALAYALDLRFTLDPIPALPNRPVMLIGPPGAGKTVTVAKLAARAVLLGRGVDIISTDTLRAGAKEQMQSFASILKEDLVCVNNSAELEARLSDLRRREPRRPCFIDTPGTNPFSRAELKDLRTFVRALDVEPVLVVAAGSDAAELSDIAHVFSTHGVQRFIVTRIDAARRLGGILAAADSAKLSLAQFSMTPYIGRGLSTMNPMSLARLLLDEPRTQSPATPPETDSDIPEYEL